MALAEALEQALRGSGDPWSAATDRAIRTELLCTALDDPLRPSTVLQLVRVLMRREPRGTVARELIAAVSLLVAHDPERELRDVVGPGSVRERRRAEGASEGEG